MTDSLSVEVSQPLPPYSPPGSALTLAADVQAIHPMTTNCAVVTGDDYIRVGNDLKRIKGLFKRGEEMRVAEKEPYLSEGRKVDAFYKEPLAWLKSAETTIKTALTGYEDRQEQARLKLQAKLDEQARKEREKLEARAAKAEEKGKTEKADELRDRAAMVATPIVSIETPKVAGISTRETYKAVVFDKMALIRAVAEGEVPDVVLLYDQATLNAQARLLKTALNYPGVKVELVKSMASGT